MFCSTWIPRAILEELSNQRRSKKISDGKEMKQTEPNVLQWQWNKGVNGWENGRRGIVPGTLLKLLVKDKLLHSWKVSVNAKERHSGQFKDWELFCPCMPLIKTVTRLFTAASNYSKLWLCSIDYDSHVEWMQLLLGFIDCSSVYRPPLAMV